MHDFLETQNLAMFEEGIGDKLGVLNDCWVGILFATAAGGVSLISSTHEREQTIYDTKRLHRICHRSVISVSAHSNNERDPPARRR